MKVKRRTPSGYNMNGSYFPSFSKHRTQAQNTKGLTTLDVSDNVNSDDDASDTALVEKNGESRSNS